MQCYCFRYFHLHPCLTTIPNFYTRAPLIAFPTFNTFLMNFFLSHCLSPWGGPSFYFLFDLFLSPAWCSMIRNQISKELMMDRSLNLWSKKRWNREIVSGLRTKYWNKETNKEIIVSKDDKELGKKALGCNLSNIKVLLQKTCWRIILQLLTTRSEKGSSLSRSSIWNTGETYFETPVQHIQHKTKFPKC